MSESKAIFLYDKTGIMALPWAESGVICLCVDIQHEPGINKSKLHPNIYFMGANLKSWNPPKEWTENVIFVSAFPPCDHLAVSGARWFKGKGLQLLADSIILFERATYWGEWFKVPYMIENPVSTISTYWRKPDYTFHPYEYSGYHHDDDYTKKTCLWTGGGFVMPAKWIKKDSQPDDRIHKCPPSQERANIRSATPLGFAKAVYKANSVYSPIIKDKTA